MASNANARRVHRPYDGPQPRVRGRKPRTFFSLIGTAMRNLRQKWACFEGAVMVRCHCPNALERRPIMIFQRANQFALRHNPAGYRKLPFACARKVALWFTLVWVSARPSLQAGDPKELFEKLCAPCHSKDGTAQTPAAKKLGVKDLSQSKLTDAQIIQQILEGKQDAKAASKMPAFKEKLTREETESLVPVVKAFRK